MIKDIAGVVTSYFESIFTTGECDRMDDCLHIVQHKMAEDMLDVLSSEYCAKEIKAALFQIGPTKTLGPNGMNVLFYQNFWHIVGVDVIVVVLDILNFGTMLPKINYTHIVRIPKIKSPKRISDYRSINLCNVIYKIIYKLLGNRLKLILPHLISSNQSAFVPGQLITNNVLVAYETFHSMHCKRTGRKGSMARKVDISKAYDRVEWPFLKGTMSRLGLLEGWVDKVMSCVTTPSFSTCINRKAYGIILPSRGL